MLRILVVIFSVLVADNLKAEEIIYAGPEREAYHVKLLTLALSYSPKKQYQLRGYGSYIPKQRAFNLLANDDGIDVMIGTSTIEREKLYLPIRFPILKGLNGWRVTLVNKNTPELFTNITSDSAFKRLIPGQYHTWTDTKILESNGITVAKGTDYDGIFKMLDKNRIDYFPRSVLEAEADLARYPELNLMIEPNVLIKYPNAYYFYVSKNNQVLADAIKYGLEKALADGKFDKLFWQEFGDVVEKMNIAKRRIYHLHNPFLVDKTPIERKELWLEFEQ